MFHQRTTHHATLHGYGAQRASSRGRAVAGEDDEGPGLLASPAFWIGGLISLGVWVGIAAAFGVI